MKKYRNSKKYRKIQDCTVCLVSRPGLSKQNTGNTGFEKMDGWAGKQPRQTL